MVLLPAFLMVSTVRFRSVKAIDVGWRRSSFILFLAAVGIAVFVLHPRIALVMLAYGYMCWAIVTWAIGRLRKAPVPPPRHPAPETPSDTEARD